MFWTANAQERVLYKNKNPGFSVQIGSVRLQMESIYRRDGFFNPHQITIVKFSDFLLRKWETFQNETLNDKNAKKHFQRYQWRNAG